MAMFPNDWYWAVAGSTSSIFSSKTASYQPVSLPAYAEWVAGGGAPSRVASEAELAEVLQGYGLPLGPLPAPVPQEITRAEGKLALLSTPSPTDPGKTCLDDVNAAIAAISDPVAQAKTDVYFNDEVNWDRDHPVLLAMIAQLGWSSGFVDQLFQSAINQT